MQANPLGIFALLIGFVLIIFVANSSTFSIFGDEGEGPLATGAGSSEVRNPQPLSNSFFGGFGGGGFFGTPLSSPSPIPPPPPPGVSPYADKVHISSIERGGTHPDQEYVIIRASGGSSFFSSSSGAPINVTGWTIGSLRQSYPIPQALNIPEIDADARDVVLPLGGDLVILSGVSTYRRNFRENSCTGYLTETHSFRPSLSSSCYDANRDRSVLLARGFNGACIDTIQSLASCRKPVGPFAPATIGTDCIDYMNDHFSYFGCVRDFRDRSDFLKIVWRVELGRPQKIFDPRHDRVILRDRNGLVVDEFEY